LLTLDLTDGTTDQQLLKGIIGCTCPLSLLHHSQRLQSH